MTPIPTAKAARERGEELGLSGPALDVFVRAGAPARHASRVAAAWAAALDAAGGCPVCAAGLCAIDAIGVGGTLGAWPGEGTARLPCFSGLGSGRKQAGDGGAWSAAIAAAGAAWVGDGPRLVLRPGPEGTVVAVGGDDAPGSCFPPSPGVRHLSLPVPEGWAEQIAEAVVVAAALDEPLGLVPGAEWALLDGRDLAAWGAALSTLSAARKAVADLRKETREAVRRGWRGREASVLEAALAVPPTERPSTAGRLQNRMSRIALGRAG